MVSELREQLIRLRQTLHQYPELSGQEQQTAERIRAFLAGCHPQLLLKEVGGHGVVAIYDFAAPGPSVLIRCELDALPIGEPNVFAHRSRQDGVAHKCGHDGHMAIVAGLAPWLQTRPFSRGKVILLFQPAEENGQGARSMLDDPQLQELTPDLVFALHNIPGFPLHQVIRVKGQFSATVQSVAIRLSGQQSHAAEPENGRNPAWAMAEITQAVRSWITMEPRSSDFALITPVYTTMGQPDYGISAGRGELHFTLRTWSVAAMDRLVLRLENKVHQMAQEFQLKAKLDYCDYFPATVNAEPANEMVAGAARAAGLELVEKEVPFKFGEDFGWFTQKFPGAMFGLGAGIDTPVLHNDYYDFPDALIESGLAMFQAIITQVLKS